MCWPRMRHIAGFCPGRRVGEVTGVTRWVALCHDATGTGIRFCAGAEPGVVLVGEVTSALDPALATGVAGVLVEVATP